jgi:hypothetical protein
MTLFAQTCSTMLLLLFEVFLVAMETNGKGKGASGKGGKVGKGGGKGRGKGGSNGDGSGEGKRRLTRSALDGSAIILQKKLLEA